MAHKSQSPEVAATWEPIDSLKPWAKNPRKLTDQDVARMAKLIERFGFGSTMIARAQDRRIIGGHLRLAAAKLLGMTQVPVRFLPLDEDQATALALADNQHPSLREWDDEALADVMRDLEAANVDMDGLGWTSDELDALLEGPAPEMPEPSDDVPEVQDGPADSMVGQVYELGPHRLWCGDNTDPAIRAAAVVGVGAVVTDPPYGIGYNASGAGGNGWTKRAPTQWDSSRPSPETFSWMLSASPVVVLWGGNYFADLLPPTMGWLVWDKGQREFSLADCELAWSSLNQAARAITYSRAAALQDGKKHPTQKPVAVMTWTMEKTCDGVTTVLDPFGGSGTTLLACAKTGRVARLIELDPHYCDVIRRRWTAYADEAGVDAGPGALR